jgi:hypothetical protein
MAIETKYVPDVMFHVLLVLITGQLEIGLDVLLVQEHMTLGICPCNNV